MVVIIENKNGVKIRVNQIYVSALVKGGEWKEVESIKEVKRVKKTK